MTERTVLGRGVGDFLSILKAKTTDKIAAGAATVVGGFVGIEMGKTYGSVFVGTASGLATLFLLAFAWSLACAPWRNLKEDRDAAQSRATAAEVALSAERARTTALEESGRRKLAALEDTTGAQIAEANARLAEAVERAEIAGGDLMLTHAKLARMTQDRDGYKGNSEMYERTIQEQGALLQKYRADEQEQFRNTRDAANDVSQVVALVLTVVAQARGRSIPPQFMQQGLPRAVRSDRRWAAVEVRLHHLWEETRAYQRLHAAWFPQNPGLVGTIRAQTLPDRSEPLDAQELRVRQAVEAVLSEIDAIRSEAEVRFSAYVAIDKGLARP